MTFDRIIIAIPADHRCFAGHFPGDPLVPGALLVAWIVQELEQRYPYLRITGVQKMKFLQPLRPGSRLELEIGFKDGEKISVTGLVNTQPALKGLMETVRVN